MKFDDAQEMPEYRYQQNRSRYKIKLIPGLTKVSVAPDHGTVHILYIDSSK